MFLCCCLWWMMLDVNLNMLINEKWLRNDQFPMSPRWGICMFWSRTFFEKASWHLSLQMGRSLRSQRNPCSCEAKLAAMGKAFALSLRLHCHCGVAMITVTECSRSSGSAPRCPEDSGHMGYICWYLLPSLACEDCRCGGSVATTTRSTRDELSCEDSSTKMQNLWPEFAGHVWADPVAVWRLRLHSFSLNQ